MTDIPDYKTYQYGGGGQDLPPPPPQDGDTTIKTPSGLPPEIEQAYLNLKQFEGKDVSTLARDQQESFTASILTIRNYMSSKAENTQLYASNPFQSVADVAKLSGKDFDVNMLATLLFGRPILPTPRPTSLGAGGGIPNDVVGNRFLAGGMMAATRAVQIDLAALEVYTKRTLGMQSAEMTLFTTDISMELAQIEKEIYEKQAEQAMWEMIGACVSLGFATTGVLMSLGAGAMQLRGLHEESTAPQGKSDIKDASVKSEPPKKSSWTVKGDTLAGINRSTESVGGNVSSIIVNASKMAINQELALLNQMKVQLEAGKKNGEEAKKTMEDERDYSDKTLEKINRDAQEANHSVNQIMSWQR